MNDQTDRPPAHQPGFDRPTTHQAGSDRPPNHQPGSDRPQAGPDRPPTHQPGSDRPPAGPDRPPTHQPGSDRPPNHQPDSDRPQAGPDRPPTHQPGSDRPQAGPDRPPTHQPGSDRPPTHQPGSDRPPTGPDRPQAPADHQQFLNSAFRAAQQTQREFAVPASVTLAQAILESNWGNAHIGSANNYFGIKAQGPTSFGSIANGAVQARTREVIHGHSVMVNAWFRAYGNMNDSFRDHGAFLRNNSRYQAAFQHIGNPDEFARQIARAGYATDPTYADKLINIMRTYNLYQYDSGNR